MISATDHKTEHNKFGAFLQQLRTSRQAGIAPTARAAGLHRSTLHRWERGEALPRLWELNALLTTLEVTARQKKQALALMDAPRAQEQVRQQVKRIADNLDIQNLPHGGDLLRAMRLRRRWTLEEAASQIGISDRTLRRWEQGTIWPAIPQLHAVCFTLKAEEEEVVALTCGHLQFVNSGDSEEPLSPEVMEQHLWAMDRRFAAGKNRLAELDILTVKRQAWRLAAKQERGRRVLALAHYIHARYHITSGNVTEEGREATKALEMLPEKEYGGHFALFAAVMAARGETYGGKQKTPRQGIERLRHWLPVKRWTEAAAWARSEMAAFLCEQGDIEAGLALNEEARIMVKGSAATHQKRRDYSHACLLFQYANRPSEAVKIVPKPEQESPHFQIEATLLRAEILMALGESSESHCSLTSALNDMKTYQMEHFQPRADALMQQL